MSPVVRKKLIEVALPLEAINREAAREKSIRHGHPSTLHLWWARRPLAAARAVIFAQMVDDPSSVPEEFPTEEAQADERQRLFRLIEDLVLWESTTNERVLEAARAEIRRSWARWSRESGEDPAKLPPFHDPFAGGGALPLEAQRLGLEAHASDLNPVAVTICKAMIEIPPRFAGRPPVSPDAQKDRLKMKGGWRGAAGLAEDIRYYGAWMRDEAKNRIGHLYPDATLPDGSKATVIAWLWARTVESPNPAFRGCHVPLVSSYWLSTKPGKMTWVEPVVDGKDYRFEIRTGTPKDEKAVDGGTKLGRGANFRCVLSGSPIEPEYIKAEGMAGRMGARLMAVVAEGARARVYLAPTKTMEEVAVGARPTWRPEQQLPNDPRNFWTVSYGLNHFADLFTPRQLVALTTFSDLVGEAHERIRADAAAAGVSTDVTPLRDGGSGATAYAEAVGVYLAFLVSAVADDLSSLVTWRPSHGTGATRSTFARQALPMVWDYAEANPFAEAAGDMLSAREAVSRVVAILPCTRPGTAVQLNAAQWPSRGARVISTDPPYYDNVGYADLSDFFYVWLRRVLQTTYPSLFSTLLVPKDEELVATPYRHGGRERAEAFFRAGMTQAIQRLAESAHLGFPMTIYYAFKQSESDHEGTASTGWETFLEAVLGAGFSLTGTWPVRTERGGKITAKTNVLASSIVLVCRPRVSTATVTTRRDFLGALKREMPLALRHLQEGNIAPVDLAQASIGPGMAIFTRYAKVLESDGLPMSVRTALSLINQALDEVLAEQEGDFDADTAWAVAWFDQFGLVEGPFGEAETLSKAKNTSPRGLEEAGIAVAKGGKVRLRRVDELPLEWDPAKDGRLTVWETTHHLIRALGQGESAAAALLARLGGVGDAARELAYRLYSICERRKRSAEAQAYNGLVQAWPELARLSLGTPKRPDDDGKLFEGA